jgi:hypothetical protein
MKYEMIFGDEKLFDGAPECVTHATKGGGFYYVDRGIVKFISNLTFSARDVCELTGYLVAERRIIKEPKRWTLEDKKAGRLPEVGSIVSSVAYGYTCSVVAIDSNSRHIWCQFPDQSVGSCMIFEINPIETPSEKAQREEDEFVDALVSEYNKMPSSISFKAGIRAANRREIC